MRLVRSMKDLHCRRQLDRRRRRFIKNMFGDEDRQWGMKRNGHRDRITWRESISINSPSSFRNRKCA